MDETLKGIIYVMSILAFIAFWIWVGVRGYIQEKKEKKDLEKEFRD